MVCSPVAGIGDERTIRARPMRQPGTAGKGMATTMGPVGIRRSSGWMIAPLVLMLCVIPLRQLRSLAVRYHTRRRRANRLARDPETACTARDTQSHGAAYVPRANVLIFRKSSGAAGSGTVYFLP